jgi:hypothetical protein
VPILTYMQLGVSLVAHQSLCLRLNKKERVVKVDETFGQGHWDLALKEKICISAPLRLSDVAARCDNACRRSVASPLMSEYVRLKLFIVFAV